MTFLYKLIQAKIKHAQVKKNAQRESDRERKRKRAAGNPETEAVNDSNGESEVDTEKDLGDMDETMIDPANALDKQEDITYTRETNIEI